MDFGILCLYLEHSFLFLRRNSSYLFLFFRYDWYAMGNFIVISVFAKLSDPEQTFVEANKTVVSRNCVA